MCDSVRSRVKGNRVERGGRYLFVSQRVLLLRYTPAALLLGSDGMRFEMVR